MKNYLITHKVDKEHIDEIMLKVANKVLGAMDELYSEMNGILFYCLSKRTCDTHLIEDAISKTFIIVGEKSSTVCRNNCFGWIIGIAKNCLKNELRSAKKVTFNDDLAFNTAITAEINWDYISVKHDISQLDLFSQEIIKSLFYLDLTVRKTAKRLNTSVSTVKRKIKEVIGKLKRRYEDD